MLNLRILIGEGSPTYRKIFMTALTELDKNAAVTFASNDAELADFIKHHKCDIIIVDAELSGLRLKEFLRSVASDMPAALTLVTMQPSKLNERFGGEAMACGAFSFLVKPIQNSYDENLRLIKADLHFIYHAALEKHNARVAANKPVVKAASDLCEGTFRADLVLIAVSTGGPMALETILPGLPENFPAPIVVVQHMPPPFINTLAAHLNQKTPLNVKVSEDGERLAAGTVYIAAGGLHTKICAGGRFALDDSPPVHGVRPAADVLFESVADCFRGNVLAVVLTGMGNDGEKGLAKLKNCNNCCCLAQSEKTCVVYGMPRVVAEAGLADEVADLGDIAAEIVRLTARWSGRLTKGAIHLPLSQISISEAEAFLFREYISETSGIVIAPDKNYLIETRLSKLMLDAGADSFGEFYKYVMSGKDPQMPQKIINEIATSETQWFRDAAPWKVMEEHVLPRLVSEIASGAKKRARIWSAAASTGQEIYSTVMCVDNYLKKHSVKNVTLKDFEFFATDISSSVLEIAKKGCYNKISIMRGLSEEYKARYFKEKENGSAWNLLPEIRNAVSFRQFNLKNSYGILGRFDVIFCRYVLIYFSNEMKKDVVKKMHDALTADGVVFLGNYTLFDLMRDGFEAKEYGNSTYYIKKEEEF